MQNSKIRIFKFKPSNRFTSLIRHPKINSTNTEIDLINYQFISRDFSQLINVSIICSVSRVNQVS